jgi:uncharacterized membrane protein YphA (DoxX/SURF4 family)
MKKKILLGVCILFGLMFINSGLNKFFNYMPMPTDMPEKMIKVMTAFMEIGWLMPLVAVVASGLPIVLVLLAIEIWIIIEERAKYLSLIK